MPATVGTPTLDWILELAGATHDEVDVLLAQSKPGANGVTAPPYFSLDRYEVGFAYYLETLSAARGLWQRA